MFRRAQRQSIGVANSKAIHSLMPIEVSFAPVEIIHCLIFAALFGVVLRLSSVIGGQKAQARPIYFCSTFVLCFSFLRGTFVYFAAKELKIEICEFCQQRRRIFFARMFQIFTVFLFQDLTIACSRNFNGPLFAEIIKTM